MIWWTLLPSALFLGLVSSLLGSEFSPPQSIYWGAWISGDTYGVGNPPWNPAAVDIFERHAGKNISILHWGQPWWHCNGTCSYQLFDLQRSQYEAVRQEGAIPLVDWASFDYAAPELLNQPAFSLSTIIAGQHDEYIREWATQAKAWGHPFFLRFDHEMNGWWTPWGEGRLKTGEIVNGNSPGDFVKARRHVHDIFTAVGATNVTWVWAPNHIGASSQYPALSTLYPGSGYVNWTGLSVYNKYSTWAGLNPLLTGSQGMTWLKNTYNIMLTIAPTKPMMLAEFASVEAGDGGAKKAAWITDALTRQIPINFPKIKAVVWMNWDINTGKTYPIESSAAATTAWANAIASTTYAGNRYAGLNASPIPSPAALGAGPSTAPDDLSVIAPDLTAPPVTTP